MNKTRLRQCCIIVPNRPGELSRLTEMIWKEGVNIDFAMTEFLGYIASVRFVFTEEKGLRGKLAKAGYRVMESDAFVLDLPNRPGELHKLTRSLTEAGIEIRYLYAVSQGSVSKVVFAVDKNEAAACIVNGFVEDLAAAV